MYAEPRIDEPHVSIVMRSGVVIGNDKADGKKEVEAAWVRQIVEKVPPFNILKEKEVFMEAK